MTTTNTTTARTEPTLTSSAIEIVFTTMASTTMANMIAPTAMGSTELIRTAIVIAIGTSQAITNEPTRCRKTIGTERKLVQRSAADGGMELPPDVRTAKLDEASLRIRQPVSSRDQDKIVSFIAKRSGKDTDAV